MRDRRLGIPALLAAILLAGPLLGAQDGAASTLDPKVDALLGELAGADAGIESLVAKISYDRIDRALQSRQLRSGELRYLTSDRSDAPRRRFLVRFETYADEFQSRSEVQEWGFDGRWLTEKNYRGKSFTRRELARPGDEIDPMRLGEGPIPLPLGQRKADILRVFEVEQRPVLDGLAAPTSEQIADGLEDDAAPYREIVSAASDVVQLRLVPKPGANASEFDEIRLWYARDGGGRRLPLLSRAARLDRDGEETDVAYVTLLVDEVNEPIDPERLWIAPPPPDETGDWTISVRRLDEEAGR